MVEHATVPSQTAPATTATNLSDVTWNQVPLLTQRIILGQVPVSHSFGVQVLYGLASPADSVPSSADVALHARLVSFDTENSVVQAKGAVSYKLAQGSANILT